MGNQRDSRSADDKEQIRRFQEAAHELGCDDGEALERAFGKIVPPKRPEWKVADKPNKALQR